MSRWISQESLSRSVKRLLITPRLFWGASPFVVGICTRRNFGFANDAKERVHSLSPFSGSSEHASQKTNFIRGSFSRKGKLFVIADHRPLTSILSPTVGERRTIQSLSTSLPLAYQRGYSSRGMLQRPRAQRTQLSLGVRPRAVTIRCRSSLP